MKRCVVCLFYVVLLACLLALEMMIGFCVLISFGLCFCFLIAEYPMFVIHGNNANYRVCIHAQ